MRPKLSIVIPVYQNEGTIAQVCGALSEILDSHPSELDYELVLVNDGSTDRSWDVLCRLHHENPNRITLVNFTRNFGQVAALLAGYTHADGNCIASISADLQEPAGLVWEMFRAWRQGNKLVVASRTARDDGIISDLMSGVGWSLLRKFVAPSIPKGGFDVFLMDRELCDLYTKDPEQNIFIQGRLLYYGFKPFIVPYVRRKRPTGRSQTAFGRKITYLIDGFAAYSFLPLRIMSATGIFLFVAAGIAACIIAWYVLRYGSRVEGWASLIIVVLFLNGIQMLALGVIGEYLWRTMQESRKRPHYVVESMTQATARSESPRSLPGKSSSIGPGTNPPFETDSGSRAT